jgi:PKD repeat protein
VIATTQVVVPVAAEFKCTNVCRNYTFTDISTFIPGETIANYFWSFGDLNFMSGAFPVISHTYAAGGTYSVTLTVTTANGCRLPSAR